MAIKVCGSWELGWDTPIKEHDRWCFGLQDFGVDEWIMYPITGIRSEYVTEFETLEEVIAANPTMTPVFVVENGEIESKDFNPPENPLYILGKASSNPWAGKYANELSVRIDTPFQKGGLWADQAIFIILRDRQWQ